MTPHSDHRTFYHDGARELQARIGTERLATHIADKYVHSAMGAEHQALVRQADCVYLATADAAGRPDCSYKGGLPGFIAVPDDKTIVVPNYDGNGMFRSLGNVIVNPAVGLLFIDFERQLKLRINGDATVSTAPEDLSAFPGADAIVTVVITAVFENCPRYLHDRTAGTHSAYCPRPGYVTPHPDWKRKPEYVGIVDLG
jgi:uncharacterized protein